MDVIGAGGRRGREVLDKLLPHVGALMKPCAVFYLVLMDPVNEPAEVAKHLATQGFQVEVRLAVNGY